MKIQLLVFFLLISTAVLAEKISPELRSIVETSAPGEKLQLIIVATERLNASQAAQLSTLNARILVNFTLAPWYEIEIPAANVPQLEGFKFIKEIKHVKAYKSQLDKEQTVGQKANYNIWLSFVFIMGIVLLYILLKKSIAVS